MSFLDAISRAKQFLREHRRVSLAVLEREFDLDPTELKAVVDELVDIQGVATRDGVAIEWLKGSHGGDVYEPSELAGERRHASVMFCDLAGYTQLNENFDPEEVEQLMRRLKALAIDVVEAHGGIVNQFVGDEVMAVFGMPVAFGDDARRAVRAASELHQRADELIGGAFGHATELSLHTGIATGLILAVARDERDGHFGLTGDTVNVAARLRSLADGGDVLVDHATQHLASRDFVLEELPTTEVKGRTGAITPFKVGSPRSVAAARQSLFVGRQVELDQFESVVRRVLGGDGAEVVFVRGEAGIGKTRFVEECEHRANQAGFASHKALVFSFGSGIGSDALRALLWHVLGLAQDEELSHRQQTVEQLTNRLSLTTDRLAALNDLLDVAQTGEAKSAYDAMAPATREQKLIETAATVVRSAAEQQPLLLMVEDLHWASEPTLQQTAALVSELSDAPILYVLTSRIEGDPLDRSWQNQAGNTPISIIDLLSLDREEALQLAAGYLAAGSETALACVERADGNPLFLEELLQHSDESGLSQSLPGTVQGVVLARLDRLTAIDKRALQTASILGQRFSLAALQYLMETPDYSCDEPIRHHLVRPSGDELIFSHALIQEGVYESILRARARSLHLRAAEWFSARDVMLRARHLDRGGSEEAAQAYALAARAQLESYRHNDALELARRSVEVAATDRDLTAARCLVGQIHNELGGASQAMEEFETALKTAASDMEFCQAHLGIAYSLRTLDRVEEALPVVDLARHHATQASLASELAEIHTLEGNLHFHLGNFAECQSAHEAAMHHATQAKSPEREARAKSSLADLYWFRSNAPLANQHYRESAALARDLGLGRVEVANHVLEAYSQIWVDPSRSGEILGIAEESLAMAKRVNDPRTMLFAHVSSISLPAEMLAGAYNVEAICDELEVLSEAIGARRFLPLSINARGRTAYRQGDLASARDYHERSLEVCRETGFAFVGPYTLGLLARAQEDPQKARELLAEGETLLTSSVGHNRLAFYRDAIYVWLTQENWDEADRLSQALADLRGPEDWPWLDGFVARARTMVRFGRGERTEDLLQDIQRLSEEVTSQGLWEPGFELVGAV